MAREVLDELAEAAFDVANRGTSSLRASGPQRDLWRSIAQAVRDADRPYQSPTPDAYAASNRALEFHRARAQEAVATAQGMLGALITLAGGRNSAELERLGESLLRLADDRVPKEK